jgi:hypothetical protein
VVLSVLYPTSVSNPRPEYTFPEEHGWYRLPHMQRPGGTRAHAAESAGQADLTKGGLQRSLPDSSLKQGLSRTGYSIS